MMNCAMDVKGGAMSTATVIYSTSNSNTRKTHTAVTVAPNVSKLKNNIRKKKMLKTDYIKAFTKAIEEADLENENVVRNLDNALVMASAKYEGDKCINIGCRYYNDNTDVFETTNSPRFNFDLYDYRLNPIPQYKPFDVESFKPYRDCWFKPVDSDFTFKIANYASYGVTVVWWTDKAGKISWKEFMEQYTLDGEPAGVKVDGNS